MANQITDNRTLVTNADAVGSFAGSTSPVLDTEIYIQGTGSIAEHMTNALRWVAFDAGAAQNWSNNVFYLWINCGVVGLLLTKASGGMRVRFIGPTTTDFFEVYVGGSDDWPTSVSGGWAQFVVDIEDARATAITNGWTGGTPPATSAVQYVGYAAQTTIMTRNTDNTWLDAIWRLPDGNPGIIVEGRNGGTTPWTFDDIVTQLGVGAGSARFGPAGSIVLNTPVQFFIDDATTHAFSDSGKDVFWDNQEYAPADLYGMLILGAVTGTANFTLGSKSGTGDAATGQLGCKIKALSTSVRWYFDADAANIDLVGLYGCTFEHGSDFQLDNAPVEVVSSFFLDCTSAALSTVGLFVRNTIIDANTADSVAFLSTDNISDIVYSSFSFSDGHAIELTSGGPTSQTSKGNLFSGYGGTPGTNNTPSSGSTDAAIYNNSAASITLNITDNGDSPSIRNAASSTMAVVNAYTHTVTGLAAGSQVIWIRVSDDVELANVTETGGTAAYSYGYTADFDVDVQILSINSLNKIVRITLSNTNATLPASQAVDRVYFNP